MFTLGELERLMQLVQNPGAKFACQPMDSEILRKVKWSEDMLINAQEIRYE